MMSMIVTTLSFYTLSLEEFYTGKLVMPAFTGPDDAALFLLILSCISAYYGSTELWATEIELPFIGSTKTGHVTTYLMFAFCFMSNVFSSV